LIFLLLLFNMQREKLSFVYCLPFGSTTWRTCSVTGKKKILWVFIRSGKYESGRFWRFQGGFTKVKGTSSLQSDFEKTELSGREGEERGLTFDWLGNSNFLGVTEFEQLKYTSNRWVSLGVVFTNTIISIKFNVMTRMITVT
jgi:hypothetical protein